MESNCESYSRRCRWARSLWYERYGERIRPNDVRMVLDCSVSLVTALRRLGYIHLKGWRRAAEEVDNHCDCD